MMDGQKGKLWALPSLCLCLAFFIPLFFLLFYCVLADTRVNHTGVLAVGNYLGSSLAVGIFTFVVNSLYGFNYVKINL